jgi:hypothetical protein
MHGTLMVCFDAPLKQPVENLLLIDENDEVACFIIYPNVDYWFDVCIISRSLVVIFNLL